MNKEKNVVKSRAIEMLYDIDASSIETLIMLIDTKHGDSLKLNVAFAGEFKNAVACCGEFLRAIAGYKDDDAV